MMRIFPKCWRNVNQNDNGKSNFTTHNGHHHKSTKNKFGRKPGGKRIILSCWWEDTMASASIMHSLWMTGKTLSRGTKPRIWEKPISWENHVVVLNTALQFENIYLMYSYKYSRKSRRKDEQNENRIFLTTEDLRSFLAWDYLKKQNLDLLL